VMSPRWGCCDCTPSGAEGLIPSVAEGWGVYVYQISRLGFARRAVVETRSCYNNTAPEGRHHNSSIGAKCFVPRAKPRFYPERSRGVRFVIYQISRLGFARRAVVEPRGGVFM